MTGRAQIGSDVDVAVSADGDVALRLSKARFALEESTIPYQVDLLHLEQCSAEMRQQIAQEGRLLWTNSILNQL